MSSTEIERVERIEAAPVPKNPTTDGWTTVVHEVAEFASHICGTEFVPKEVRGSAPKVAAAILTGRELGMPPMTALATINVIQGKPGLSAEAMRALVLQAGHEISFAEVSSSKVTVRGRRSGTEEWTSVSWTMSDANQAGATRNPVWKNYPRQMLTARATTELCRLIFADVIHGLRSFEELEDSARQIEASMAAASLRDAAEQQEPSRPVARARKASKTAVGAAEPTVPDPSNGGEKVSAPGASSGEPPARRRMDLLGREKPATAEPVPDADGVVDAEVVEEPTEQQEADQQPEQAPPQVDDGPAMMTGSQSRMVHALLREYGIEEDRRHEYLSVLADRLVTSASDLTKVEAKRILDRLNDAEDREDLDRKIAGMK